MVTNLAVLWVGSTVHQIGDIAHIDRAKSGLAQAPYLYDLNVYQHIE